MCELKKFYCIYTRGGKITLESAKAPSFDDALETLDDNGETFILPEFDMRILFHLLYKEFGEPTYKVDDIKHLEQNINYAVKHGALSEEQGEELLKQLDKGFGWLHKCVH